MPSVSALSTPLLTGLGKTLAVAPTQSSSAPAPSVTPQTIPAQTTTPASATSAPLTKSKGLYITKN